MTDGNSIITGKYLKQLFLIQKEEKVKPVRNLTIKHVLPSNLEKMNVRRAILVFSPPVTAAIKFLMLHPNRHPKGSLFANAGSTIKFLKQFYKWFTMHDVCNTTQHVTTRNTDRGHFFFFL